MAKIDPDLKKELSKNAEIIEFTFKAFGIDTRVVEIENLKEHVSYQVELAIGVPIKLVEEHQRDLALALASPTGKIELVAPIPGTIFIGINVPKGDKNKVLRESKEGKYKLIRVHKEAKETKTTTKIFKFIAELLDLLVMGIYKIARLIDPNE